MAAFKKVGAFLLAALLVAVVKVAVSTPSSSFAATKDWPAAVARSRAERLPIFLVFGGSW